MLNVVMLNIMAPFVAKVFSQVYYLWVRPGVFCTGLCKVLIVRSFWVSLDFTTYSQILDLTDNSFHEKTPRFSSQLQSPGGNMGPRYGLRLLLREKSQNC